MAANVISDTLKQKESPTKDQRKVVQKDQLRYGRSLLGCVSQDACPRRSILREPGILGSKTPRQILQRHLAQN